MRAGSLFSGVGGLDLGLARAGFQHAFFCESDPWRRSILAHHWPGVPIYEDVGSVAREPERRAVSTGIASGDVGSGAEPQLSVDLLCGGFPCQDLSVAGRRAGLGGERSSLFFEFARIAESLRPRWILIENVPGFLSSNGGRDFGVALESLADIGYGVAWRILDSRYFGVPQRRRRVFILGARADGDPRAAAERCGEILAVGTRCERHSQARGEAGEGSADSLVDGAAFSLRRDPGGTTGNGWNTNYVMGVSENQRAEVRETPYVRQLTSGGGKPGQGYPTVRESMGVRRLTPVECERLQAWPDGWTNPDGTAADSRRYAAIGDGVTASVAEWIGKRLAA